MTSKAIRPSRALYIKLGLAGAWESDCITRDQTLRLDYREAPHDLCLRGKWDEVREIYKAFRKDIGAATRDSKQIRLFYESDETVLWITFFGDRMYWCFSKPEITLLEDKSKIRPVIGQWRSTDIKNNPLQKNQLSGRLLSTEGFRGTICSVKEFDYLVQRINGRPLKQIGEAKEALLTLEQKIETLIRALHWKDFEILIDLIFRQAGWQRVSDLGGTQKTIDLDLLSPMTLERYAVQIKSEADLADFEDYQRKFADMQSYTRIYFVVHTPSSNLIQAEGISGSDTELLLPKRIAELAVQYGLLNWIIEKGS